MTSRTLREFGSSSRTASVVSNETSRAGIAPPPIRPASEWCDAGPKGAATRLLRIEKPATLWIFVVSKALQTSTRQDVACAWPHGLPEPEPIIRMLCSGAGYFDGALAVCWRARPEVDVNCWAF